MNLHNLVKAQREYFYKDETKDLSFRLFMLNKLEEIVDLYEEDIIEALFLDLGKSSFEAYSTEIFMIKEEIRYIKRNLKYWMEPEREKTPIISMPGESFTYYEPLGVNLIISPWNYPIQLALTPLVGSIAAGNTAIIKPSSKSKNSTKLLIEMINNNFPNEFIYIIDPEEISREELLYEKYDHIFFTGSPKSGRNIMQAAAKNLTKVTLELGGKSPCIVDETANLEAAAKRIVWGKLTNSGQTCIAPDYLAIKNSIKEEFIEILKDTINEFYGDNPIENPEYPKIIDRKHFDKLVELIRDQEIVFGGNYDSEKLKISPTIIDNVNLENKIMKEEIFGPIFPILTFNELDGLIYTLKRMEKPLALYYFTEDQDSYKKVIDSISFGGGCINDTLSHVASSYLEFGGVGNSGMGGYHGKYSFITFSNRKSVMVRNTNIDPDIKYPPYGDTKLSLLKKFTK